MGESGDGLKIPAADTGSEIFFNNLELLRRFALLPVADQKIFLSAVRNAMDDKKVETLWLHVPWAHNRTRNITVNRFSHDGSLEFRQLGR